MASTDNVEKGIRRGDPDVSLQALSRLAPAERGPFLEPVGALFRAAVQSDHQAKNWSKLISWASRAEKVPGLEGAPGSPDFLRTGWSLTWAAVKTKDWPRAQRWYQPIHPALLEGSPAFAAVMAAVVAGSATPETVAPFLIGDPEDPRLGLEKKRLRLEWTAPSSLDDVEQTLLAMVASEPWAVFATNVTQWAAKVDAATRSRMLHLAGQLATRETLKRLSSRNGNPGEPAHLLRFAVEKLQAPASLAADALLMFRLLAARVSREHGTAAAAVRELTHGAMAASPYDALRPLVVGFVTSLEVPREASSSLMNVLEHLLGQRPELALVAKALLSLADGDPTRPEAHRPSPALAQALSTVITTDREGLARWFNELQAPRRHNLAQWMSFLLPVEVVQPFILAAWTGASKPTRGDLVTAVENVILRMRDSLGLEDFDPDDFDDFDDPFDGPLPPKARPFWSAVRDLVLPEALAFLPFAVREASGENPTELIDRALGEQPTIEKMLQAWELLWHDDHTALCRHVETGIFKRYGQDLHALIHGVVEAHLAKLPLTLQRKLAQALRDESEGTCDCPDFKPALELVDTLLNPPRANKSKSKKKSGRGNPPPDNGSLPF